MHEPISGRYGSDGYKSGDDDVNPAVITPASELNRHFTGYGRRLKERTQCKKKRAMGNKLSNRKCNVLLLGLPGAGKTTLLNKFRFGEALPTTTTFGFSREKFEYRNIKFTAWDVGGDESRNTLSVTWRAHVKNVDAVIFIVDATTDRARLMNAAALLRQYFAADAELL